MSEKEFLVEKKIVMTETVKVSAENADEAIEKVKNGEGKDAGCESEYFYTLPSEEWTVFNVQ